MGIRQVWNGTRLITKNGLRKCDLMKNKKNKIVSKAISNKQGRGGKTKLSEWSSALTMARKELNLKGFILVNRGVDGVKLYKKAKSIYAVLKKKKLEKEAQAKAKNGTKLPPKVKTD